MGLISGTLNHLEDLDSVATDAVGFSLVHQYAHEVGQLHQCRLGLGVLCHEFIDQLFLSGDIP
jgi:hypothetical protein